MQYTLHDDMLPLHVLLKYNTTHTKLRRMTTTMIGTERTPLQTVAAGLLSITAISPCLLNILRVFAVFLSAT